LLLLLLLVAGGAHSLTLIGFDSAFCCSVVDLTDTSATAIMSESDKVASALLLPPKSREIWAIIGLFGFSNYLLRTVLGYIAVAMDHETPGGSGDNNRKAIVLSSFFVGYASNNVLAGLAASRFGGMTVLHVACVGWSVCTMLVPTVFDLSDGNAVSVGIVMLVLGVCCAPMFPASQAVLSFFSTPSTISLGASLRAGGCHAGSIVTTFATPFLLSAMGWRALLQLYGALGLVVVAVSMFCGPSGGNQMNRPKLTVESSRKVEMKEEVQGIGEAGREVGDCEEDSDNESNDCLEESVEMKILCDSSVLSAYVTHMANNLANYTLLSYMPTYFVDVLDLNMADTAPYLVPSRFSMLLGVVVSGYLSKYILNNQLLTLTQTRRDGACVCLAGTAIALFMIPLAESPEATAVCLGCSTFFIGAFEVFLQSTYIDLTSDMPEYAGFLCGSGNTLGALPGALGPFFVSQILTRFDSWLMVFWTISSSLVVSAVCHSYYGSTKSVNVEKKMKV
jgi:ACS family sodium-dependent inorganic phosphate cotransporter